MWLSFCSNATNTPNPQAEQPRADEADVAAAVAAVKAMQAEMPGTRVAFVSCSILLFALYQHVCILIHYASKQCGLNNTHSRHILLLAFPAPPRRFTLAPTQLRTAPHTAHLHTAHNNTLHTNKHTQLTGPCQLLKCLATFLQHTPSSASSQPPTQL